MIQREAIWVYDPENVASISGTKAAILVLDIPARGNGPREHMHIPWQYTLQKWHTSIS